MRTRGLSEWTCIRACEWVMAGVHVHGDLFGKAESEPAQFLQCGGQERRVVPVRRCDDNAERDPGADDSPTGDDQ